MRVARFECVLDSFKCGLGCFEMCVWVGLHVVFGCLLWCWMVLACGSGLFHMCFFWFCLNCVVGLFQRVLIGSTCFGCFRVCLFFQTVLLGVVKCGVGRFNVGIVCFLTCVFGSC